MHAEGLSRCSFCEGKHLVNSHLRTCSSMSTAIVLHPACDRAFTQASPIPAAPPATRKPHLCNHAMYIYSVGHKSVRCMHLFGDPPAVAVLQGGQDKIGADP